MTVEQTVLSEAQAQSNEIGGILPEAQDAPPAPEPEKIAEHKEKEAEQRLSSRMAYLARRERALFERERALKESLGKYKEYETLDKTITENPLDFMEKKGWDYNRITQKVLETGPLTTEQKLEMLEKKLADRELQQTQEAEQRRVAEQQQRESQALDAYKDQIRKAAEAGADKYDFVNSFEGHELVLEIAEQYYNKFKKVIRPEDALDEAEKILEEKYLPSLLKSNKLRSQFGVKKAETPDPQAPTGSVTLTNKTTASPSAFTTERRFKSADESLAEAAKLLKWND